LRKPTDQRRSPSPSRHSSSSNHPQRQGSRRNSTYSDASEGSDFDEVNLAEEITVLVREGDAEELSGERVELAFQATSARRSRMVCIDSGANIFILTFLLELYESLRRAVNKTVKTAAAGGQLHVEALFNCGHVQDIRFCPTARANLMPTNVLVLLRCAVLFDMELGTPCCTIIANEGSHGGDQDIKFNIACVRDNDLWWISEQQTLDIVHRKGFPLAEAQRVVSEQAIVEESWVAEVARRARPFMERPETADWCKVMRWIQASRHHYSTTSSLSKKEWIEAARQDCFRESPYGKRFAVHELGLSERALPMRDFTTQDEEIHDAYVESRRVIVLSRRQDWNFLAEGEAEMRWIEAWNAGVQLMPLPAPVVPASLVALDNADDVLINDIVYSTFSANELLCTTWSDSTSLATKSESTSENKQAQQSTIPVAYLSSSSTTDVLGLMHERTGHQNKRSLIECVKSRLVTGLQIESKHIRKYKQDDRHVCDICARSKLTRTIFKKLHTIRGQALGEYISVDIAVFVNCESREGYKYVVCFVDHSTKFSWVYAMKTRDEYIEKLRHLIDVELHSHGAKIKHYHADGGAELISKQVLTLLKREGARYTWNPADTPELNATSERKFRTLGERCLSMLLRAGLPVDFWWDAYETSNYLTVRLPTKTAHGYMTPFEGVYGKVADLSHLRIWGCKAYLKLPKDYQRKDWRDKAFTGYFVGYNEPGAMGYRLYIPDLRETVVG
jgi:hypothetical protein